MNRYLSASESCRFRVRMPIKIALLLAIVGLMSCKPRGPEVRTWQEEVKLGDGRIVMLERQEQYHFTQEFGGLGEMHTDASRLTMSLSKSEALPPLTTHEMPLIFDVEPNTGEFFVITIVDLCTRAQKVGLDWHKPYFEYRLVGSEWQRAPVSAGKIGWQANLLISREIAATGKVISLAKKTAKDRNPGIGLIYKNVSANVC